MKWSTYYLILAANLVICWPCIRDGGPPWRIAWSLLGLLAAALPWWLPTLLAFYYGLLANAALFSWSADTLMGKEIRRLRGVVGGILLLPVPIIFQQMQTSWAASLLVPTLGHLVVSGASWPIVVRVLAKAVVRDDRHV